MKIKLSQWAKQNGLSYMTAWRMTRNGKHPLPVEILDTGTILVELPSIENQIKPTVLYGRVSSHDQKDDLTRQMERLRSFAAAQGLIVSSEVSEIGSGLNGKRPKLIKLLKADTHILIEHHDRLSRFGVEYIVAALAAQNRKLTVINQTENKLDLVQDFVDVTTSMCARIYGNRSAKNRAERALAAADQARE